MGRLIMDKAFLNQMQTLRSQARVYHMRGLRHWLPMWLCDRLGHPLWAHPDERAIWNVR